VDKITSDDVLSVLKPLWNEKPETASRLCGRIERVLMPPKRKGCALVKTLRGGAAILISSCPSVRVSRAVTTRP
jgi:hypothetical protein